MRIDAAAFWAQVEKTDTCWLWTGRKDKYGYGKFGHKLAHRVAWFLTNGEIPEGINVLHTCDNPPCVRPNHPDHLYLGTQSENMRDAWARTRKWSPKLAAMLTARNKSRARLSDQDRAAIIATAESGVSQSETARKHGVSQSYVSRLVCQKRGV